MYTVGLDADIYILVSVLEDILILKIKLLAGNNIFNLSPPLLGIFLFIIIYFNLLNKGKYVFSNKCKNKIYLYTCEVGIIYKFLPQIFIVGYIRSADCLLILP